MKEKTLTEKEKILIIGKRLNEGRTEKRLTIREVEYYTKINRSTLSRIERGAKPVNAQEIIQLCNLYNLTADDLFWGLM